MSADVLQAAARLMRENAEAVVAYTDEWYTAGELGDFLLRVDVPNSAQGCDAAHIASWHPAVALAVADWLEREAEWGDIGAQNSPMPEALAVARAYLGAES